ncbi:hypothetical protein V8C37DRAFT_414417 [Trichoderma ceciliae]
MSPRISRLPAVAALAAVASAATSSYNSTKPVEPCGQITQLISEGTTIFTSQLALACLESTPFKSSLAVSFIDEYNKYLQWQSTIEILRNPPPGSLSATVDLQGGISSIRSRAAADLYKSQYDFDLDLNNLLSSTNDGHLFVDPCSFVFAFGNTVPLVSLSTDGIAIPQLYTQNAYVEQLSDIQAFQDPDARYNAMLGNVPISRQGQEQTGGFALYFAFPGVHEFNLTYANGTQATYPLLAELSTSVNFTFTTGDELWEAVCDPKNSSSNSSSEMNEAAMELPAPATYPEPVVKDPLNILVGYFPTDSGLEDVAVLTVPTFETFGDGLPDNEIVNFALEAQTFVMEAVAAGKSKIIIDVTGNNGGTIDSGFALVSVFFPNMTIFSASRYRSVPATQYIIETINRAKDPQDSILFGPIFFVPALVKPDQRSTFKSVSEFEGPFDAFGVPSTAILAVDTFGDTDPSIDPINIFGLGGILNGTEPPFRPEDIVILTDGQCASTCTVFVNHMIPYGVRVVAVGGRPQAGPMQGIGGVKGAQTLTLDTISGFYDAANELVKNATDAKQPLFTDEEFSKFQSAIPVPFAELPIKLDGGQVNFRNAFSPFNDDLPTQFIYQAADCRLFYTPQTLTKPETLWVNTANAIWGDGACVFRNAPRKALLLTTTSPSSPPASTSNSTSDSGKKHKTQSSAHKALGLLLAMAEGLRP